MVFRIIFSLAIAAALVYLLWLLRGVMLTPVHRGKNSELSVTVYVTGPAEDLEQTVDGLMWLISNGTLDARIVIVDGGMDEATAHLAAGLADSRRIELCRPEEVCRLKRNTLK